MKRPQSPLAGKSHVVPEAVFSTAEVTKDYRTVYDINVENCFAGIPEIAKWRCIESGLSFFTPNTCAGGADFYKSLGRHDWYYMAEKWEYSAALRHLPRKGSVLEVGCGNGHFLDKCARKGLRSVGLELSPPDSGRSTANGVSILEEPIAEHASANAGRYNAVCSFQVLEHVPEPKPFLEACCEAARPGGSIIIGTPNADSFLRHARSLLDMPPHHITGWRKETFRYLETILPLKLKRVIYEPLAEYHVDFFFRTYQKRYAKSAYFRGLWAKKPFVSLFRKLFYAGGRRLVRGQSIMAVFTRV
jgi:2-polyprenyl-3-methyl-5-hydroxy-6-metoxy-1,4-benzoquinol methylase